MKETAEFLKEIPLFGKLDDDELGMVREISAVKKFPKDRIIFLEGEKFTGFYVVLSGSVKVYKLSGSGDETVLHILKPYRSFAEAPVLTGATVYPACAEATEDSLLYYVPAAEFRKLLKNSSSVAIKISEVLALRLTELNRRFGQLSANVEGRLARYIVGEITLNGTVDKREPFFVLSSSKKDLASQLGMAVETLSRALRKLKDRKIIRECSKKIFVADLKRLKEIS
jgi:CRP-like cAMP-binding protein